MSNNKLLKKKIIVREHLRKVKISPKNPSGTTLVDSHYRYKEGKYLDPVLIKNIFKNYNKKNLKFPSKSKLKLPNEDNYDDYIAVWVDYFNENLNLKRPYGSKHDKGFNSI